MKWITVVLYVPQFEDRLLSGNDLESDQDKHGLEMLKNDLKPANIVLHTAWRRAQDRADWKNFVSTATLH